MKKTLAIVLAVIMIVACTASSMFAAEKDPNDYYWYMWGPVSYAPLALGDTPQTGFAVSFDLRFEERYWSNNVFPWGLNSYNTIYSNDFGAPFIDATTYMIGVDETVIPYDGDWEQGVWYHFVFDNTDGQTVKISCDGVEIGTIEETLSLEFGFSPEYRDVSIDNIVTYRGPITYFKQDFSNKDNVITYEGKAAYGEYYCDADFVVFKGDPNVPDDETTPVEGEETEAPATEAPVTEAPATEAPATEAPATEAPATEAPATEAPATEAPATEAPTTDESTADETTADETTADESTAEETTADESTAAPATEAPATDAPAADNTQTTVIIVVAAVAALAVIAVIIFIVKKKRS